MTLNLANPRDLLTVLTSKLPELHKFIVQFNEDMQKPDAAMENMDIGRMLLTMLDNQVLIMSALTLSVQNMVNQLTAQEQQHVIAAADQFSRRFGGRR